MATQLNGKDLAAQVKAGVLEVVKSDAWREMLDAHAKFWEYSFANTFLIWMQKPDASRVAGFRTWKAVGRSVKKGESGLAILRPIFPKRNADTAQGKNEDTSETKRTGRPIAFAKAYVFDISQTEGKDLPSVARKLVGEEGFTYWAPLESLAISWGVAVKLDSMGQEKGGFVHKVKDGAEIVINQANAPAQRVKTLLHELGHFKAGHLDNVGKMTREEQELEAESCAYIAGRVLGLDFSEYSFGYLAGWCNGEDVEKKLSKSLETAARTARAILEGVGVERSKLSALD